MNDAQPPDDIFRVAIQLSRVWRFGYNIFALH